MHPAHYTKKDWLFAALTALIVLVFASGALKTGIDYWGDDYAAYMNQGFALADGRLEEQLELNAVMHPTLLPDEAQDGKLVYAWGFPLLEALVYRIVGFDRTDYSQVVCYKLILLVSLAVCGGVMVLFFRRRFSLWASVCMALLFCLNSRLLYEFNMLYGDLVFLCFSMLTLLLGECFAFSRKIPVRILTGAGFALSMLFTHLLRLNGFTVIVIVLLGHILCFVQKKIPFRWKDLAWHLFPYALLGVLVWACDRYLLPQATSNMSDFSRANWNSFIRNLKIVLSEPYNFFENTTCFRTYIIGLGACVFSVLGLFTRAVRENIHLLVLWLGTLLVYLFLPYSQGVRYMYNALPVMLMFAVYGLRMVFRVFGLMKRPAWRTAAFACLALLVLCTLFPLGRDVAGNLSGLKDDGRTGVYSEQAIEAYHYIQENTEEDAVIAFGKPRGLYLSTGRVSIWPGRNGHKLRDADYLLINRLNMFEYSYYKESEVRQYYVCVFENRDFALYDLTQRVSSGGVQTAQ